MALEDLALSTRLTKPLGDYEQIAPHVAAAKRSLESGKPVHAGETIEYVITSREGSISDKADVLGNAKDYDKEYYIYNQLLPPVLKVLSDFGFKEADFDTVDEKQTQIYSFVSKSISAKLREKLTVLGRYKTFEN